ncbi:MAG TPA: hypothetical protein VMJ64_13880 [Anaerolineales bacterium]|nr:hypothetical protein [Anaerolineales bacterium]
MATVSFLNDSDHDNHQRDKDYQLLETIAPRMRKLRLTFLPDSPGASDPNGIDKHWNVIKAYAHEPHPEKSLQTQWHAASQSGAERGEAKQERQDNTERILSNNDPWAEPQHIQSDELSNANHANTGQWQYSTQVRGA